MSEKNILELIEVFETNVKYTNNLSDSLDKFVKNFTNTNKAFEGAIKQIESYNFNKHQEDLNEQVKNIKDSYKEVEKIFTELNEAYTNLSQVNKNTLTIRKSIACINADVKKNTDELKQLSSIQKLLVEKLDTVIDNTNKPTQYSDNNTQYEIKSLVETGNLAVAFDNKLLLINQMDSNNIYMCDKDLKNMKKITTIGGVKNLQVYKDNAYYTDSNRILCRLDKNGHSWPLVFEEKVEYFKIHNHQIIASTNKGMLIYDIEGMYTRFILEISNPLFDIIDNNIVYIGKDTLTYKYNIETEKKEIIM